MRVKKSLFNLFKNIKDILQRVNKDKTMEKEKENTKTITIKVCMGSSCFARGNAANLDYIEKFVKDHGLDAKIDVVGSRCENNCAVGPNVIINGENCESASPVRLEAILKKYL